MYVAKLRPLLTDGTFGPNYVTAIAEICDDWFHQPRLDRPVADRGQPLAGPAREPVTQPGDARILPVGDDGVAGVDHRLPLVFPDRRRTSPPGRRPPGAGR
jgi:hypothetical protein